MCGIWNIAQKNSFLCFVYSNYHHVFLSIAFFDIYNSFDLVCTSHACHEYAINFSFLLPQDNELTNKWFKWKYFVCYHICICALVNFSYAIRIFQAIKILYMHYIICCKVWYKTTTWIYCTFPVGEHNWILSLSYGKLINAGNWQPRVKEPKWEIEGEWEQHAIFRFILKAVALVHCCCVCIFAYP